LPGPIVVVVASLIVLGASAARAQAQPADRAGMTGEQLYQTACAACHGSDGKGQPRSVVGFDTELPDFTDCAFTTPEADVDWWSVVHEGGRARALDRRMPAFGDALSDPEIDNVIRHVRGFCAEPGWPRGDLNFPRVFFTEKAFPENEAVFTIAMTGKPEVSADPQFLFEHRLGKRAQYEINVPLAFHKDVGGSWSRGLGDINLALKYALYDSLPRGLIVSAGGEVTVPTGKESAGLGGGVTIYEGFGMFGKTLPGDGFLQFHAGFEVPSDTDVASKEIYWRTAIGKTFAARRWGRAWSPMVEVLAAKASAAPTDWDVVPQLQVSLSGLQHVLLNVGLRSPIHQPLSRSKTLMVYLLWDWFDGGLASNWRTR
jgi:mono/diheme cytochrome c family protein